MRRRTRAEHAILFHILCQAPRPLVQLFLSRHALAHLQSALPVLEHIEWSNHPLAPGISPSWAVLPVLFNQSRYYLHYRGVFACLGHGLLAVRRHYLGGSKYPSGHFMTTSSASLKLRRILRTKSEAEGVLVMSSYCNIRLGQQA